MVRVYLTRHQALRLLGRPYQRKLFAHLARKSGIEVVRVGRVTGVAESDLPKLRAALREWDDRPRLSRATS